MRYCPKFNAVLVTTDLPGKAAFVRARCRQWDCEFCARRNRAQWQQHLTKRLHHVSDNWWFLTLTASPISHADKTTLKALRRGIDLLFKRMRRFITFAYVRVYEVHKTRAFHAHLIISGLPARVWWRLARSGERINHIVPPEQIPYRHPKARAVSYPYHRDDRVFLGALARIWHNWSIKSWLKRQAQETGMGYMVDVKRIPTQVAIRYVTKYLTKEAQAFSEPNLHRVAVSRAIGSPKTSSDKRWIVKEKGIMWQDVEHYNNLDRDVVDLQTGEVITLDMFDKDHLSFPLPDDDA